MVTQNPPRPIAESHSTHGALSAEPDELTLPGWLNAAKGSRSYNRVVHILELIHQNEQNVRNIVAKGAHIHVGPKKWPREHLKLWRADDGLRRKLEQALKRYTFSIRLTGFIFGDPWLLNMY